jgi:hypothetical protein
VNAGLGLALNRHFTPFELGNERMLLSERLSEIIAGLEAVMERVEGAALQSVRASLESMRRTLWKLPSDQ